MKKKLICLISIVFISVFVFTLTACNKVEDINADEASKILLDAYIKTCESSNIRASVFYGVEDNIEDQCWESDYTITLTGNLSDTKLQVDYNGYAYDDPDDRTWYEVSYESMFLGKGNDNKYYRFDKENLSEYKNGSEIITSREYDNSYEILEQSDFFDAISNNKNAFEYSHVFCEIQEYINSPKTQITCQKTIKKKIASYSVNMVCNSEWENSEGSTTTKHLMKYYISTTITDGYITNMEATGEYYKNNVLDDTYSEKSRILFEYNVPDLIIPDLSEYL